MAWGSASTTTAAGFWGSSGSAKAATRPSSPHIPPVPRSGPEIDATTIVSLLLFVSLIGAAYAASVKILPPSSTIKTRILFVWHAFDALIHFVFEGTFLINCFFVSYSLPTSFNVAARRHPHIRLLTPPDVYWLGREDRLYGANYGETPISHLWQEYAKADRRWGGVDLGIVSLEVLTVFVGAPLAGMCVQSMVVWLRQISRRAKDKPLVPEYSLSHIAGHLLTVLHLSIRLRAAPSRRTKRHIEKMVLDDDSRNCRALWRCVFPFYLLSLISFLLFRRPRRLTRRTVGRETWSRPDVRCV